MTDQERGFNHQLYDIYTGILYQNAAFAPGEKAEVQYDLSCPEYAQLKEKYPIEEIAGEGGDFERAERLLHHLAPRLKHSSWYDNHVPQNSIALMDYSYGKPENGINCLNKSKIFSECCLALGIYARRVSIGPYSPYDCDTHVVAEIFDRAEQRWIMLDPTVNGYIVDKDGRPLSCLDMRERMARQDMCTLLLPGQEALKADGLFEENIETNAYFAKNLLYISLEKYHGFGAREGDKLYFLPERFRLKETVDESFRYRIRYARAHNMGEEVIHSVEKAAEMTAQAKYTAGDPNLLRDAPRQ